MDGEIVPKSPSCPKVAHKAPSVTTALPEPWDADRHRIPSCLLLCPKGSLCHLALQPRSQHRGSLGQKCCSDPGFLPASPRFLNGGKKCA